MNTSAAILLLAQALVACTSGSMLSGTSAKDGASAESTSTPSENSTDGSKTVDAPVPVGGSYLVCAAEYQDTEAVTEQSYGCRLDVNGAKVEVPASASPEIRLFANDTPVTSTLSNTAADSPWSWLVRTSATGPFTAELTLRNVAVKQIPVLTVSPGSASYVFTKASVEGSALTLVPNGGVAQLIVTTEDTGIFEAINFTTVFPKFLRCDAEAKGGIDAGFELPGATRLFCVYRPAAGSKLYYAITKECYLNGVATTVSLDQPVTNAILWSIDFEPGDAPAGNVYGAVRQIQP